MAVTELDEWLSEKLEELEDATTAIGDASKALATCECVECKADFFGNVEEAREALQKALDVCKQMLAVRA